jgi:AcrR family transcriptional regulator
VREWIPTPASAKGRLVLAALEAFGRDGYDAVAVADLARAAATTTGPLYHHFGSKLGLYSFVREDVERRVLDRMEGALEVGAEPAEALVVAFDYVRRAGLVRMLSEPHPERPTDPVAALLADRLGRAAPLGTMLAAAWRAALAASADGASDASVRAAIRALRVAERP